MDSATGWNAAENAANKQQNITEDCKMEEVRIALAAIKKSPYVESDNELLDLRFFDVKPNIKRQKNYELSVKTSALSNMIRTGINGLHALKTVSLFEDPAQTWADSEELIKAYQDSLFNKESADKKEDPQTIDGGLEGQIGNSPLIDGMSNEKPKKMEG